MRAPVNQIEFRPRGDAGVNDVLQGWTILAHQRQEQIASLLQHPQAGRIGFDRFGVAFQFTHKLIKRINRRVKATLPAASVWINPFEGD